MRKYCDDAPLLRSLICPSGLSLPFIYTTVVPQTGGRSLLIPANKETYKCQVDVGGVRRSQQSQRFHVQVDNQPRGVVHPRRPVTSPLGPFGLKIYRISWDGSILQTEIN